MTRHPTCRTLLQGPLPFLLGWLFPKHAQTTPRRPARSAPLPALLRRFAVRPRGTAGMTTYHYGARGRLTRVQERPAAPAAHREGGG